MRLIGLTGGIASGKSTVSKMFQSLGAKVLDADVVYHQLLTPINGEPSPLAQHIVEYFPDVLLPTSFIDRTKLRDHVFNDANKKQKLEDITHPAIRRAVQHQLQQWHQEKIVIYDVPLLFEKHMPFKEVVLVYVPLEIQMKRLQLRDGIDANEAKKRIAQQMPLAEKIKLATWVIDNSQSMEQTQKQVEVLWQNL